MRHAPARPTSPLLVLCLLATAPALAVDLFVKPAGSGTACTQSSPCTLATALATAAAADAIHLAAGVYTGTGTEVVLLDKTVSVLGGWSGAPSGAVVRDPVAYESILDGEYARRVVKVTAGAPTLDGLTIRRGNASGLTNGCGAVFRVTIACAGGVLFGAVGGTLSNNLFIDNVADTTATDPGKGALGGAVHASSPAALTIRDNVFRNNLASSAAWGLGGAVQVDGPRGPLVIAGNRFVGNRGTTSFDSAGAGGAISIQDRPSPETRIEKNVFVDNVARDAAPGYWGGDGNAIDAYQLTGVIRGNVIHSDAPGSAVRLYHSDGSFEGNSLFGGPGFAALFLMERGRSSLRVANNVIHGGVDATVRAQSSPGSPLIADLIGNTIVNSKAGRGVWVLANTVVTVMNSIIAGHQVGIEVGGNGSVVVDHSLFHDNALDGIPGTSPIVGDPLFVNAPAGDFHLQEGSAAIGAGLDAGVATDIDGDARPGLGGVDVGADELAPRRFDFGTPGSPVASSHAQVTHATAFTPERGFGWTYGTIASRDRGTANNDLRRDLCFATTANFGVTLPNGRYRVTVTMGDAAAGHGQMAVHLETVKVATASSAGNEFKELTFETAVADGRLDLWLNDEGGTDPNVVVNALVIEPAPPVMVDLGTAASPLAAGYGRATHATDWAPGAAFGWAGGIVQSRDRGTADPLTRDLVFSPRALLASYVPNGVYDVVITMGDAAAAHNMMGVSAQGMAFDQVSTARNQFVSRRYRTHVADNRLEVLLDDLEGPDVNTVINAVEVRTPPLLRFDFGTPSSPVSPGYLRVSHATAYSAQLGYGWSSGTVASRDRLAGNALERDFAFTPDGTFVVDMPPGFYRLALLFGDATTRHDEMAVEIEGTRYPAVTAGAGQHPSRGYGLYVLDGQLTVRLVDEGGSDPNVALNALEIR